MFESLTDRFEGIFSRLRSRGRLSDADVDEVLREIRTALLEADVEIGVVRKFTDAVRQRCVGLELVQNLSPGQQVIKIVNEELVGILGGETLRITYAGRPPTVVLLAGLQGSGKTTTSAKLARWFKQQGRNPLLVGADLQRPAAVEQLRVLGEQAGITVFSEPTDPVAVATAGLEEARRLGRDVLIVDTAGRLAIDEDLMDEIRHIAGAVDPHYTFLVIDAMTGQDAVSTAAAFHDALSLDGVILTKLDGDARGGAALSVKEVVGRPIAFASTGEKLDDFDQFHPDRMADRILGMGDVLSLIEQADRTMDKEVTTKGAAAMIEGRFTLEDFLEQLQQVKKMGSVSGMLSLLPGSAQGPQAGVVGHRRPPDRADRGDHPLDDPDRAGRSVHHRRWPTGQDRQRQRHGHLGRQCAPQAVQGDAEDDEGPRQGRHGRCHGGSGWTVRPWPQDVPPGDGGHGRDGRDGRRRRRPVGHGRHGPGTRRSRGRADVLSRRFGGATQGVRQVEGQGREEGQGRRKGDAQGSVSASGRRDRVSGRPGPTWAGPILRL